MILLFVFLCGWNAIRAIVAWWNCWSPIRLQSNHVIENFSVTVCIPARNEVHNLPYLLEDLMNQSGPSFEVMVVDDHSEDGTSELVQTYLTKWPDLSLIQGSDLPKDWMGKQWACAQAAQKVTTDWILFLDADLRLHPQAIQSVLQHATKHRLSLLSVFPTQIMESNGERWTVPLVHRILLELLPMSVANRTQWASMAAGNGQLMLFRSKDYFLSGGHEAVKLEKAEDIALVRRLRKLKFPTHTLLGNQLVKCRMYSSWTSALRGFAKNIHAMMLSSYGFQLVYWFFGMAAYGILAFYHPLLLIIPLFFAWLAHFGAAKASGEPEPWNPIQQTAITINFFSFSLFAVYTQLTRTTQWKGRKIN